MSAVVIEAEIRNWTALDRGRETAMQGFASARRYMTEPRNRTEVERALRIRAVENALYDLFGMGKLHGTIHTCIGQEFSGAILGKHIRQGDFVTSNHRCHGHFIGATENWHGLIDEIIGNRDGVCAGIGSSQHLWAHNFMSNGQQGGLLPVAAGIAYDRTLDGGQDVVFSFLGEGTLGEGILYETLNVASLWNLPQIFICENNFYSQSTSQDQSVSGSIGERAASFGMISVEADTWNLPKFDALLAKAVERARAGGGPTFITLATYRLNPHSKGDDLRGRDEVDWFRTHDPATWAVTNDPHLMAYYASFLRELSLYIESSLRKAELAPDRYFDDQRPNFDHGIPRWLPMGAPAADQGRVSQQLNVFYKAWLDRDAEACFLGEDIADPYGGAFKIAKGLSTAFPDRVRTTPISEAAITGIGIGLAVSGRRAFVEIMFGDFITYAFDQIINNASKIYAMYNRNISCPVIVRTPMGGRRGYGPTHSQSLERFLVGIDNCCTVSVNSLVQVEYQLAGLDTLACPVILLENKSDYTAKTYTAVDGMMIETDGAVLPTIRLRTSQARSGVTLLAYGGMARFVADHIIEIFERTDVVPELIVPTALCPLNLGPIAESVARTGHLVVIEEGAGFGSVGAEIIAQLGESAGMPPSVRRVFGRPTPIPSAPSLEAAALPSVDDICAAIDAVKARRP